MTFCYYGVVAGIAQSRVGKEDDIAQPISAGGLRLPSEQIAIGLAKKGVRSSVVRLPPSVHDKNDHGLFPD